MLKNSSFKQLSRGRFVHSIHRHDAAVEHERLVAGIQENLICPYPEGRLVLTVVVGNAHPWVRPDRELIIVMRAGRRSDGQDTLLEYMVS